MRASSETTLGYRKMNLRAGFMTKFQNKKLEFSQTLIALQNLCLLSAAVSVTAAAALIDHDAKCNTMNLHFQSIWWIGPSSLLQHAPKIKRSCYQAFNTLNLLSNTTNKFLINCYC